MLFKKVIVYCTPLLLFLRILELTFNQQLIYYIHPKYITFSVVLVVFALVISLSHKNTTTMKKSELLLYTLLIIFLSLPAQTLSGSIAENRNQKSITVKSAQPTMYDSFAQDFSNYNLQDWSAFLNSYRGAMDVSGKKASISGFLFYEKEQAYIARFKLSCCAVDATPITVPIQYDDTTLPLIAGNWYEVEGTFERSNDSFMLNIQKATSIPQPEQPYVY